MAFLAALAGIYEAGLLVSLVVLWVRAGLTKHQTGVDWREFALSNLGWLVIFWIGRAVAWPAVLWMWWSGGRQPCAWRAVTELNGRPARAIVRTR